jgi:hypothetical protein
MKWIGEEEVPIELESIEIDHRSAEIYINIVLGPKNDTASSTIILSRLELELIYSKYKQVMQL